MIDGKKEINLGSLTPTRDFNYVSDTANGMIKIALCPEAEGEVINIGSGEEWSIGQTVEKIAKILDVEVEIISDKKRIRPSKSEVNRLVCDNSKIKKLTNWKSEVSFEEGLSKTISWIRCNKSLFTTNQYSK